MNLEFTRYSDTIQNARKKTDIEKYDVNHHNCKIQQNKQYFMIDEKDQLSTALMVLRYKSRYELKWNLIYLQILGIL